MATVAPGRGEPLAGAPREAGKERNGEVQADTAAAGPRDGSPDEMDSGAVCGTPRLMRLGPLCPFLLGGLRSSVLHPQAGRARGPNRANLDPETRDQSRTGRKESVEPGH